MASYVIGPDDPETPDVQALLDRHLSFAHTHSPPEDVYALDGSALRTDDITFCSVRRDGELLGVGALRRLDGIHAEIKSMHTAEQARGRGVGRMMLEHLLALARTRGYQRVSLETGTMAAFAAARALYLSAGFTPCAPFGSYRISPNSVCMTLELAVSLAEPLSGRGSVRGVDQQGQVLPVRGEDTEQP